MEEEKRGKKTEELLESINSLLDKMPGLLKQAEELQISRRELEKEKAETELKMQPGKETIISSGERLNAEEGRYNEYQIPSIPQITGTSETEYVEEIKKRQNVRNSDSSGKPASYGSGDPVFRRAPASISQDHKRRVVFLYSEDSSLLLETFLNDMDSLSLASKSNPFFVSRASVRKSDGNEAPEIAKAGIQSDVSGLVYLGLMREDDERILSGLCLHEGIAFLRCDETSYSKDILLDFLIELIAIEKVML